MKKSIFLLSGLFLIGLKVPMVAQESHASDEWTDLEVSQYYRFENDALFPIALDMSPKVKKEAVKNAFIQLKYPTVARENGVVGTVLVRVQIDSKGSYVNASILEGIGSGCDEEAILLVQRILRAGVRPAMKNEKSIDVIFDMPVKFGLK